MRSYKSGYGKVFEEIAFQESHMVVLVERLSYVLPTAKYWISVHVTLLDVYFNKYDEAELRSLAYGKCGTA